MFLLVSEMQFMEAAERPLGAQADDGGPNRADLTTMHRRINESFSRPSATNTQGTPIGPLNRQNTVTLFPCGEEPNGRSRKKN